MPNQQSNNYHFGGIMLHRFLIYIPLIFVLGGCGFIAHVFQSQQLQESMLKNPNGFIGKYFEASPYGAIVGASNTDTFWSVRASAHSIGKEVGYKGAFDPNLQKTLKDEYLSNGLLVNLNKGSNSEDKKAKLLFEVENVKKENGDVFLKVKILNKKYLGTTWWVNGTSVFINAKIIASPFRAK